jgi:hypothetical protein
VIEERYKGTEVGNYIAEAINEVSQDMVITSSSSIVIDDDTKPAERKIAIDQFTADIRGMSGTRIIAVAIACDL